MPLSPEWALGTWDSVMNELAHICRSHGMHRRSPVTWQLLVTPRFALAAWQAGPRLILVVRLCTPLAALDLLVVHALHVALSSAGGSRRGAKPAADAEEATTA